MTRLTILSRPENFEIFDFFAKNIIIIIIKYCQIIYCAIKAVYSLAEIDN